MATRLVAVLQTLGITGEISLEGRWVKLQGARCAVYVVEVMWGTRYYTWCDSPAERTVESYLDPASAIQAGLRRAGGPAPTATERPAD